MQGKSHLSRYHCEVQNNKHHRVIDIEILEGYNTGRYVCQYSLGTGEALKLPKVRFILEYLLLESTSKLQRMAILRTQLNYFSLSKHGFDLTVEGFLLEVFGMKPAILAISSMADFRLSNDLSMSGCNKHLPENCIKCT